MNARKLFYSYLFIYLLICELEGYFESCCHLTSVHSHAVAGLHTFLHNSSNLNFVSIFNTSYVKVCTDIASMRKVVGMRVCVCVCLFVLLIEAIEVQI